MSIPLIALLVASAWSAIIPLAQRMDDKPPKCVAGVAARGCPPVILHTLLAGEITVERAAAGSDVQRFDLRGRLPVRLPRTRGLSLVLLLRDARGPGRGCSSGGQPDCAAMIWPAGRSRVSTSTITVGTQRLFLQPSGALSPLPNEEPGRGARSPILARKQLWAIELTRQLRGNSPVVLHLELVGSHVRDVPIAYELVLERQARKIL
jgi:hypothetical protein